MQYTKREYQKTTATSPGPVEYYPPNDPGRKPAANQRPLSGQNTFINTFAKSYHGTAGT